MNERTVVVRTQTGTRLENTVVCGPHTLVADEPEELGGHDRGPMPFELLAAALGACTNMTLRLYAERKGYALTDVSVALSQTGSGNERLVERVITLSGDLDAEARQRLLDIANKCPVHRALEGSKVKVSTRLAD
jgi:putative redox protein